MMRTLLVCAAAALTLGACQRNAEETVPTPAADDMAMDATPADTAPAASGSGRTAASADAARAASADEASADTTATAGVPTDENDPASSSVSQSTRDGAKEKAESTNLHPRT